MSDSTGDSSDNYEDDPIIVFDQETESSNGFDSDQQQQSPIGFGFRQPSFVRLHGEPIPKGFDSLADFRAEKPPVKVEPFVDFHINNNSNMNPNSYSSLNTNQNQTSNSIHELLQRRNSRKWEEMGYDPKIMEKSLNRNTSQSAFVPSEIAITAGGHISSSFTNIDSFKIDEKHQIQNDLILETVLEESPIKITDFNQNSNSINNNNINSNSNNQNGKVLAIDENSRKNNNNKLTRSLSSGEVFPSIEMPANEENSSSNYIPFCTELCKDLNEYNYEEEDSYESCEDCNIPPNLLPFLVHERGTFTYRALDGETLKGLQESAVELITDNLNYYLEIAIENNMFSEMCYLQVIIEKLKNDNSGLSINEMSEIDYRICETSTDIDDILRLYVLMNNIFCFFSIFNNNFSKN
ncbi:hypothetical protein TRFO_38108 [Tritrichomonas foetus]|uniref:Uncharacterized protein n=1 Tax=Tritrichomonas foetus TaxID=1144522 RepID=A0A1J4J9B1_9EUKA|nr:hypothetical protein TRFO_38108 [Tritrichomonas foetus]|eukprot:OHS95778.1 hypothetical protein TRFO_38108 [Tritrichomonas foetus]